MAGNLQGSYGAQNFVLLDDYKMRINSLDVGQPEVNVILSGNVPTVQTVTWKRGVMEESIRFKYVGMDYDTAQDCADAMRTKFTYLKYSWAYGYYLSGGHLLYGWHRGAYTPTLDSAVIVQKNGSGCMYDVVVDGHAITESYSTTGYAGTGSFPIENNLNYIPGYTSNPTLSGKHFSAASISNLTLVNAPTRTTTFELVGEDIYTTKYASALSVSLTKDNWYRATTDFNAQVKYEGMTKAACKSLFNSLNTTTGGWIMAQHPWVLSAWFSSTETSSVKLLNIGWAEDTSVTSWQCLNDYRATEDDSGMFTAELMLHAQDIKMTKTPESYVVPNWPSIWNNVPGLGSYL